MKKGAKDGVEEDVKGFFLKKDSALGKMSREEKREETEENRGNGDGSQG